MSLTAFVYPLAILVWSVFSLRGLVFRKKYWGQFTPRGSPRFLSSFLRVIDLISILVRPFTLLLRLAANITAGHLILGLVAGVYQSFKLCDWSITTIKLDSILKYWEALEQSTYFVYNFDLFYLHQGVNFLINYTLSTPLNLFFIHFSISGSLKSLSIFFVHIGYWIFEIFVAVIQSFIFCRLLYLYLEEHIITWHSNIW